MVFICPLLAYWIFWFWVGFALVHHEMTPIQEIEFYNEDYPIYKKGSNLYVSSFGRGSIKKDFSYVKLTMRVVGQNTTDINIITSYLKSLGFKEEEIIVKLLEKKERKKNPNKYIFSIKISTNNVPSIKKLYSNKNVNTLVKPPYISRAEVYFEDPTPEEMQELLKGAVKKAYERAAKSAKIRNFSLEDMRLHIIQKEKLRNLERSFEDELAEGLALSVWVDFQIKELHLKNRTLFAIEVRFRTIFFWIKEIFMGLWFTLLYIIGFKS